MDKRKFVARQLMNAANISSVTYNQWRSRGLIRSDYTAQGTGDRQLFSFENVFAVAVMARMVALGITVGSAAKIVYPFPEGVRLGGVEVTQSGMYGSKDARAYLLVRSYPDPEHDRIGDTIEHLCQFGEVVREADLFRRVPLHEGVVIVSLNKIKNRVKQALDT